ncbi:dynein light chain roadblock-type 1 [Salpingoeca rosetta]|uniref:Dynein light chain roadblock n=1 Tax=Salpingoeca rosetta (strain ATCC 50818 / BSB-021) TaxID=946362 RepID=F2U0E6_SALR5|nr:dynein light chain roadblock-type 1 [Salpingoeca rosetta]EGD80874.1 dynein light chain roadblock-type 1 [Salpingoeca rosetta]|eukprot:XP_004997435.1 dynein light chain roadblock-type 1 [Salpingoeca rosetta]
MSAEVEETLKRISGHKGVEGIVILNKEGIAIKSTLDQTATTQYAGLISSIAAQASHVVRELDPQDGLTFLRLRSKKHEIMVAPDNDYLLVVIQNPTDA